MDDKTKIDDLKDSVQKSVKKNNYRKQEKAIRKYLASKERITIWMDPEEKQWAREKAKEENKNLSDFIRSRIFKDKVTKAK